jgi:hypothetical protein
MAVVTSNELIAWVCIAASVIGVVLLIVDALRDRSKGETAEGTGEDDEEPEADRVEDYPDEAPIAEYDDEDRVADEHGAGVERGHDAEHEAGVEPEAGVEREHGVDHDRDGSTETSDGDAKKS